MFISSSKEYWNVKTIGTWIHLSVVKSVMYKSWYICVQNRYSFLLVLFFKNETKVDYHVMYTGESEMDSVSSYVTTTANDQKGGHTKQWDGSSSFPLIEVSFRMFFVEVPVWSWWLPLSLHLDGRNVRGGKDRNLKYCLRFAPHHSLCERTPWLHLLHFHKEQVGKGCLYKFPMLNLLGLENKHSKEEAGFTYKSKMEYYHSFSPWEIGIRWWVQKVCRMILGWTNKFPWISLACDHIK